MMNRKLRRSNSRSPQFAKLQPAPPSHRLSPLTKYPIQQIQNRTALTSKYSISKLSLQKSINKLRHKQTSKCIDLTPDKKKQHQSKGEQIEIPVEQIKSLCEKITFYKKKNLQLAEELGFLKNEMKGSENGCSVMRVLQDYQ